MNKARLLKLADLLEADAKNPSGIQFDLNRWGRTDDDEPKISCGTTACAIGLACLSPEFQAEGLSFVLEQGECALIMNPKYDDVFGWDAVQRFFDISYPNARKLFGANFYNSVKGAPAEMAVAARIRCSLTKG